MIKRYLQYVVESSVSMDSLGEYVSKLAEEDKEVRNIVARYTQDIDQSVNMQSAIDILDDIDKVNLLKNIEDYQSGEEGEVKVTTGDVELVEESYGKGVFNSFLKCLTALGLKDNKPETKGVPKSYLVFFRFEEMPFEKVRKVFDRFKSLQKIRFEGSTATLFFGVKNSCSIEYGINKTPIGSFKIGKGVLNSLMNSNLKSLSGLKYCLQGLEINDLRLMCKVREAMMDFEPGYSSMAMDPSVYDRVISQGWHGWGNWNNGNISEQDINEFKSKLRNHLARYRWSDKVQMSVKAENFWIYTHIKLK